MSDTTLSIADLDMNAACERGYEFEFLDARGKGTGVHIKVLGEQSDKVQTFLRKSVNDERQRVFEASKRERGIAVTPVEQDIEFQIESAIVRTLSWRGLKEDFSAENARRLFTVNRDARDQVIAASRDIGNFTKA